VSNARFTRKANPSVATPGNFRGGQIAIDEQPHAIALAIDHGNAGYAQGCIAHNARIDLTVALDQFVHPARRQELALIDDGRMIRKALQIG